MVSEQPERFFVSEIIREQVGQSPREPKHTAWAWGLLLLLVLLQPQQAAWLGPAASHVCSRQPTNQPFSWLQPA
jgi:hypothetical protein